MKKLSKQIINKINGNSEIENNNFINQYLGLETKMNFDIWKDGCFLIEAKLDIRNRSNGLSKAQRELDIYSNKLKLNGMKLPKIKMILDYQTMSLYNYDGTKKCDLAEFNFDVPEDYENYDITFENGPNVAQQIYSRHAKINDSNIFDYFRNGIDWYNPTELNQTDFRLVLDLFNNPATQKKRGAFYTPDIYIYISTKLLRDAIKKIPKGRDYVIIDRCAGSGQLQKLLTDEELSHCVLSTIGIAEWISLWNTYGSKVRKIIPPYVNGKIIDQKTSPEDLRLQVNFEKNEIKGADALSEAFYRDNSYLWKDKHIIILENPPYSDATSNMFKKAKKGENNQSDIKKLMKGSGAFSNDLFSQFVWSAWNILKANDYIVYGPIKQWKINNLFNKKFCGGHLCNRKYFHATESTIALSYFSNENSNEYELTYENDMQTKSVIKKIISKWDLVIEHDVNLPTIAVMIAQGGNRNMMGAQLYSSDIKKTAHVKYIDIDKKNLLPNLPLFVVNFWEDKNYTTKEVVMKSADGGTTFRNDKKFINSCGNWTYFSQRVQCSENSNFWQELEKQIVLDNDLLLFSKNIIKYAGVNKWIGLKNIDNLYNTKEENKYGVYVPKNVLLDKSIWEFKQKLKEYYEKNISSKLFKYELLK